MVVCVSIKAHRIVVFFCYSQGKCAEYETCTKYTGFICCIFHAVVTLKTYIPVH